MVYFRTMVELNGAGQALESFAPAASEARPSSASRTSALAFRVKKREAQT
jgi:hypothetical protein